MIQNPEPIMLANSGGFDILLYENNWGLLFDPFQYYHSTSQLPLGKNYGNFIDLELDIIIDNYIGSIGGCHSQKDYRRT